MTLTSTPSPRQQCTGGERVPGAVAADAVRGGGRPGARGRVVCALEQLDAWLEGRAERDASRDLLPLIGAGSDQRWRDYRN